MMFVGTAPMTEFFCECGDEGVLTGPSLVLFEAQVRVAQTPRELDSGTTIGCWCSCLMLALDTNHASE